MLYVYSRPIDYKKFFLFKPKSALIEGALLCGDYLSNRMVRMTTTAATAKTMMATFKAYLNSGLSVGFNSLSSKVDSLSIWNDSPNLIKSYKFFFKSLCYKCKRSGDDM